MFESMLASLKLGMAVAGGAVAGATATITTGAIAIGSWILLAWLVTALVVARAARGRGRSAIGWLLLAILLAPPVAALMLLVLPDLSQARQRLFASRGQRGLRLCPSCAEVIRAEARCCRYCGVDLERLDRQKLAEFQARDQAQWQAKLQGQPSAGQLQRGQHQHGQHQHGQHQHSQHRAPQSARPSVPAQQRPLPQASGPVPLSQRTDPQWAATDLHNGQSITAS